jgi:hypothetical protein
MGSKSHPESPIKTVDSGSLQRLTTVEVVGLSLAAFTGLVHFYMAYEELAEPMESLVFLLAGAGFFLGIALYLRGIWPRWLFLAGVAYTGVQIPLWVIEGMEEFAVGAVDKLAQLALVLLLLYAYSQSRSVQAAKTTE